MKKMIMTLMAFLGLNGPAQAEKKVLVVLSSENKITLKGGVVHPTGFFLSELAVPLKGLVEAGYEPVFATPKGNAPVMDKVSDSSSWFGGDERKYQEAKALLAAQRGLRRPLSLREVLQGNMSDYAAVFVPGGHAPMEDLAVDPDLGGILRYFHAAGKPTALICHGPIALISALANPRQFLDGLAAGATPPAQPWIYAGYAMTSFSTPEEMQEEPGQDNALGGFVKFYPDFALNQAGGQVAVGGKWKSHVVRDRELITAQNPMSDVELTEALLEALRQ